MKRRALIIGIMVAFISYIFLILLSFIIEGKEWLQGEKADNVYWFIAFCIMFGYCGYGTAKYYFEQKENYFPYNTKMKDVNDIYKLNLWKCHRKYMYSRLFSIIAKLFAIAIPGYVLAYLDESKYLTSSIPIIIIFIIIALSSFIISKRLEKQALSK